MPLQAGDQVGDFVIIDQIGKGAFGVVYKARDIGLRRLVAIKELVAHSPGIESTDYRSQHKRFEHEVETLSRFSNPNVVAAYQILHDAYADYLVMEYVGGDSLKRLMGMGRPLPVAQAVHIALDVCSAITEMARHSIVHRDIKPGNILLTPGGQAKLTDFGVAQLGAASKRSQPSGKGRTHPGTPRYMSPEQESSVAYLDQRSDLYALGLVLYEMLTGQSYKAVRKPLRQVDPNLPRALEVAIEKVLHKEPDQRYQTAEEFAVALRRSLESSGTHPVRVSGTVPHGWAIGLGLLLIVVLMVGAVASNPAASEAGQSISVMVTLQLPSQEKPSASPSAPSRATVTAPARGFQYGSLEVAGENGKVYQINDEVTLRWEPPELGATAGVPLTYRVWITYRDTSGDRQEMVLTMAEPQVQLSSAVFFANGRSLAEDGVYAWVVAVVSKEASGQAVELSPRTSPPYTFEWRSLPSTVAPVAPVVTGTPALPSATPHPVCPSNQNWNPVMNRCQGAAGQGDSTEPTRPPAG